MTGKSVFSRLHQIPQWTLILAGSATLFGLCELANLPASALIGPMLVGVLAGSNGATARIPNRLFQFAQAILGVLIASSIELEILQVLVEDWHLFMGGVLATVAASSFLGWQISRWNILPGTTAIWGSAPGAATAMVLMAGAFGADYRLVAFMQYLRVMIVALAAAGIAAFLLPKGEVSPLGQSFFVVVDASSLAATFAVALGGASVGYLVRLPSPSFLGAMILGALLHLGFGVSFQLPPWLLTLAYALIGWSIGLNFTAEIVRHARRALPQVMGSILLLILFCAGIAFLLSRLLGIDFLTAYLATSPGGMDAIAIIAASTTSVNMSFVLAMQMARFLFVLIAGPAIARAIAGRTRAK